MKKSIFSACFRAYAFLLGELQFLHRITPLSQTSKSCRIFSFKRYDFSVKGSLTLKAQAVIMPAKSLVPCRIIFAVNNAGSNPDMGRNMAYSLIGRFQASSAATCTTLASATMVFVPLVKWLQAASLAGWRRMRRSCSVERKDQGRIKARDPFLS